MRLCLYNQRVAAKCGSYSCFVFIGHGSPFWPMKRYSASVSALPSDVTVLIRLSMIAHAPCLSSIKLAQHGSSLHCINTN